MRITSFKKISWLAVGLIGFMGACSSSTPTPGPDSEVKPAAKLSLYESQDKWPGECQHATAENQRQSPIDKTVFPKKAKADLKIKYKPAKAEVIDNGHTLQVKFLEDAGYIEFEKNKYALKQFHFHNTSEHTLDGKSYVMEAHFVHLNEGGAPGAVALGFLIEVGKGDKAWTALWSKVPAKGEVAAEAAAAPKTEVAAAPKTEVAAVAEAAKEHEKETTAEVAKEPVKEAVAETAKEPAKEEHAAAAEHHEATTLVTIEKLDVRKLIPTKGVYYTYEGSLTTPECNEYVTHAVARKPLTLKEGEIAKFVAYHPNTNRKVQPAGKPEIRKYRLIKE